MQLIRPLTSILVGAALCVPVVGSGSPAIAAPVAHSPSAITTATADTGWRVLQAARGGTVYGPDNVSITVPAGVMKRNGRVSVREVRPGIYNIHISAPWRGRVTVRLPMSADLPVVAHKKHGRWVLERAKAVDGMAVARVKSLSLFSAIRHCLPKLIGEPRGAVLRTIKCFIAEGVRALPEYITKKFIGLFNEYDPCKPVGLNNWSIDTLEIFFSSCHAGETSVPPTAPTTPPASPPPAPQPPVTPPPAPKPPTGVTIVVNTCNTYGNCDYWNPIWVHSNPAVSSRIADVSRGTALTARCWAPGRTLTDGSNNTTEDDARQFTSALWYGVDWNGGRGYVPAVWTTKREDHLGLPAC